MTMRRGLIAGAAALLVLLMANAAQAIVLIDRGNGVAELRGRFDTGDEKLFAQFLAQPRAQKIRVLWLHSPGGILSSGLAIGQIVRRSGIATAVDGNAAYCDSACTLVFVAGRQRHYVNAQDIMEGQASLTGLGFHGSFTRGNAINPAMRSDEGTRQMIAYYRAMGSPGAVELMRRAAISTLYRPNGATALKLRIATSLRGP